MVIVLAEIPAEEHNSFWLIFSAKPEVVRFGASHYQRNTNDTRRIFNRLFESYQLEGLPMPYTMEDFRRDTAREYLPLLSPEERLQGLKPEEIEALMRKLKPQPQRRPARKARATKTRASRRKGS